MGIWFYLCLIVFIFLIVVLFKMAILKNEINNILRSLTIILKSDTNHLITTSSNDKELKKLASILNQSLKELRKLELEYKNGNQELKSSITNISHDLRTPLTAIRGYLDLFDTSNLTYTQVHYLQIIDKKVTDLAELSELLFDFSKSIDLENTIQMEKLCINAVLEEVIASFYALFKEKNIEPNIILCEELVIRETNASVLMRILENILSNAIKYTEGAISIKLYFDGRIVFSNQTSKVDATSIEKIFNRYYTLESAKESNGIGLSIAKQLADLIHAKISAKYTENNLYIQVEL